MISLPFVTLCVLWILLPHSLATPIASPQPEPLSSLSETDTTGNSYSGVGGNAPGGSVAVSSPSNPGLLDAITGGKSLLSVSSGNAGSGGDASSGLASAGRLGGGGGLSKILGPSSKFKNLVPIGGITNGVPLTGLNLDSITLSSTRGNAYSGAGGSAPGGGVTTPGSLIDLFSHNAGKGGSAKSGSSSSVTRRQLLGKSRFENLDDAEASTIPEQPTEVIQPLPLRRSRAFRAV